SDPASEMQGRIRLPKSLKAGEAAEVVTMISHPMITGLQPDASGEKPAPRIIERFEASLDDRPVARATFFRSLAANPYLKFDITPQQGGEMRFQWLEDTGRKTELTQAVDWAYGKPVLKSKQAGEFAGVFSLVAGAAFEPPPFGL